jgi:hypothetical protein
MAALLQASLIEVVRHSLLQGFVLGLKLISISKEVVLKIA